MSRLTAFRFTVVAAPAQVAVLWRYAGASRFAFNECLAMVKAGLDARALDPDVRVPWTGFDLINGFNAWKRSAAAGRLMVVDSTGSIEVVVTGLRWRGEVSAQVFEEAAVDLGHGLAAFTASRRGTRRGRKVGFPRFKRKGRTVASFRLRQKPSGSRSAIRVGDPVDGGGPRSVRLPGVGVLKVREDTRRLRRMLHNGRASILSATVTHRDRGWQISLTVQAADLHPAVCHPTRPVGDDTGWVGVDRGLMVYAVAATADGREVLRVDDPPRPLRTGAARTRRLSRQVSRKQSDSAGRREAVERLRRQHTRIRRVRDRFVHEVANRLVQTHDRIALEDLHITGMLANHRLAAAISDAAWGELARRVGYKQQWRGGQVCVVDRWFPSSKTCSHCRTVATVLPLSARTFVCERCGHCRTAISTPPSTLRSGPRSSMPRSGTPSQEAR